MNIFPAIDLYEGKAVRLLRGDYQNMTVYSTDPLSVAKDFESAGAEYIHMVDLEGAKDGSAPNLEIVQSVAKNTSLFVEVGGGIRNMEVVDSYISSGVSRVILGTAAVKDEAFLREALKKHGDKIAVGVDVKDSQVAIKGWTETAPIPFMDFCKKMEALGVATLICTDISKDGAMQGTNRALYQELSKELSLKIIASGGVSDLDDIKVLKAQNLYGAIIGKAYYTHAIDLKEAIEVAKE